MSVENTNILASICSEDDSWNIESYELLSVTHCSQRNNTLNFILQIIDMYKEKNSINLECNDFKLIHRIKEICCSYNESCEFGNVPSLSITVNELLDDENLKDLLNDSWIGGQLNFALNLKEKIKKSNDFDDIF